ncbi:AraC family transcriptional regulator [Roseovarius aestuarii]|uniref:Transposon Tn10 TetD protein n=1 Tax=Roseovarius aestuarii TaxID=475083 RepID=A0A1X7BUX4_9RHOB|nr:AraC family transcriptional regulator [Roseovarius aestuarii]SMC13456.1 Transposon Tn10 TetD protein [Roseovarius aestuarii]
MQPAPISISHRGVNRAISLIQRDPAASLDLDEIADTACLSKFHFCRLFRRHMGETPVSFLWRTRLEHSALVFDYGASKSITETALEYGFSSPEAFSRAFSRTIGLSPRSFLFNTDPTTPKVAPEVQEHTQAQGGLRLEKISPAFDTRVRIEYLPACQVAFRRRKGPYNYYGNRHSGIGDGFREVIGHAHRQGLVTADSIAIGVSHNSPRLTRPEHCLYDMCVSTDKHVTHARNLDVQTLAGGRFAILSVNCPTYLIAEYWNWLTFDWLPQSGETPGVGSSFERYDVAELRSNPTSGHVELCLRLRA